LGGNFPVGPRDQTFLLLRNRTEGWILDGDVLGIVPNDRKVETRTEKNRSRIKGRLWISGVRRVAAGRKEEDWYRWQGWHS